MLKNIFGAFLSLSAIGLIVTALYITRDTIYLWGIPLIVFFVAYFPWQNENSK